MLTPFQRLPAFLLWVRLDFVEQFAGAKCGTRLLCRYGCLVDLCNFVVLDLVVANLPVVGRTEDNGQFDLSKRKRPEIERCMNVTHATQGVLPTPGTSRGSGQNSCRRVVGKRSRIIKLVCVINAPYVTCIYLGLQLGDREAKNTYLPVHVPKVCTHQAKTRIRDCTQLVRF